MTPVEDHPVPITVQPGAHVSAELVCEDHSERLEIDLVPDAQADFAKGLLGESTPLAQAILGKTVGETIAYRAGDILAVRILAVVPGQPAPGSQAATRRQEAQRRALEEIERTNAIIFASSYSGKWGDYDPGGVERWGQDTIDHDPSEPDPSP